MGGQSVDVKGLGPYLQREADALVVNGHEVADATVIVRADQSTPTGLVQELIKICQEYNFEQFALRAKEDVGN